MHRPTAKMSHPHRKADMASQLCKVIRSVRKNGCFPLRNTRNRNCPKASVVVVAAGQLANPTHDDEKTPLLNPEPVNTRGDDKTPSILTTNSHECDNAKTNIHGDPPTRIQSISICSPGRVLQADVSADTNSDEDENFIKIFAPPKKKRYWLRDAILSTAIHSDDATNGQKRPSRFARIHKKLTANAYQGTKHNSQEALDAKMSTNASQRPKRKVRFSPEVSVQQFDIHGSASSTTRTTTKAEKISDKASLNTQYRFAQTRQINRRDGIDVRFMTSKTLTNSARTEFRKGCIVRLHKISTLDDFTQGLAFHYTNRIQYEYPSLKPKPSMIRFRLMQADTGANALRDSDVFIDLAGLKKWMKFDTSKNEQWMRMNLEVEYARFLTAYRLAKRAVREEAIKEARDLNRWRGLLGRTDFECGDEIRRKMAARRIHAVIELLWLDENGSGGDDEYALGFDYEGGDWRHV